MVPSCIFPTFQANSDQCLIQIIVDFQGSYILSFQGSNTNFHLQLKYFLVFKSLSKNCIRDNTVWPELSFQGSYRNFLLFLDTFGVQMFVKKLYLVHYGLDPYCLSKDLIQISTESSYFFGVKNLFKKLYQGQYGSLNMVWPILSFQGSYTNVYLTLIYLLLLKIYWRIVSVPLWFDLCFLFQGFYQVFIKGHAFFLFQKSLRFKNFESQTIWFELYHLFRKQGSIFIKSTNRKLRPR